jgi:hypothetical protein
MVTYIELSDSPDVPALDFCLLCWMKSEVYKLKADTRDEMPARILDAAARTKGHGDQPRRATRYLRTRVAKCTEVDGGIYEHLL